MAAPTFSFYKKNRIGSSCTFSFTSAPTVSASAIYDRKRDLKLTSSGSNDATNEIWDITFKNDVAQQISAIMIDNHNIKSGTVKYWNGSSYVDFSTPISLSANTATTNFFTFTAVSTSRLRFTFSTTMTANEQKYVGQIIATDLIGTPAVPASSFVLKFKENSKVHGTDNAGHTYVQFGMKPMLKITFSDVTPSDMALFLSLKYLNSPFIIYPSGGQYEGVDIGFRIYDIYLVNYVNDFSPNLKNNILEVGQTLAMELPEV